MIMKVISRIYNFFSTWGNIMNRLYNIYQERANNGEVIDWLDGEERCFSCGENVYEHINEHKATYGSITGCPSCHRSFVD